MDTAHGGSLPRRQFRSHSLLRFSGLPTCAQWVPDPQAFIKLLTHEAPDVIGCWCLIGIVAASMSTADGAILSMGTVFSHNVMRHLDPFFPNLITDNNLLMAARLSTIPFALVSTLIAAYYRSSHSAGATGYLLIVAFDVVLATVVAPLFGAFYTKTPSPRAALCAILSGAFVRILLEFVLPKDGFLLLPFDEPEFQDYGPAASANFPVFFDKVPGDVWNATAEPCASRQFEDYTGVDSLSAFFTSIIVFVTVQFLENKMGRPLFSFPGMQGYDKIVESEHTAGKEVEDVIQDITQKGEKEVES